MFSKNAIHVLQKRYLLRNEKGELIESPEEMIERVAGCVAEADKTWGVSKSEIEELKASYYEMMAKGQFLPNSPTLMNAGRPGGQLSACFVLPVPDNLEGIFETCKNAAMIHKTGGGTGFSFSRLRPKSDPVASTVGVASGPVSFMTVYDAATEAIRQGGSRRGANMGILRVDHPDIEAFITCKRDTEKLNNFNISVAVTDAFMKALKEGKKYDLIHPRTQKPIKSVDARKIFDKIVENAHATGEPGIVFIDRINKSDPIREAFDQEGNKIGGTEDIEATNPCGEQPLGPGDACNLGSINISKFIDQTTTSIKWEELKEAIDLAVRFLDGVIEVNNYPLDFISTATLNNRRIGLGIMGWADALIMLGIAYDSDEACEMAEKVMSFFQEKAHNASARLAEIRGAFPNWQYSSWSDKGQKLRNATVTTIAPTGTISILASASSGIEPIFALSYLRRVLAGDELIEVNPLFEEVARKRGFYSDELMKRISETGTVESIDEVPEDVKRIFVCSHQIDYKWHVKMQAAFQKYTDNAVSKTINFPQTATVDEIKNAYLMAWDLGLKGITVYRDASRTSQVLNIKQTDPLKKSSPASDQPANEKEKIPRKKSWGLATATIANKGSADKASGDRIDKRHPVPESNLVTVSTVPKTSRQSGFREDNSFHKITPCPECGMSIGSMMKYEACLVCVSCGYTKC